MCQSNSQIQHENRDAELHFLQHHYHPSDHEEEEEDVQREILTNDFTLLYNDGTY